MDIKSIKDPKFLKNMSIKELESLASDIRSFLVDEISKTGGHLASNLGVVELSIALHYVFDSPEDTFIFDVSHQSYVHKILTGRVEEFKTLRQHKGLSGYASYKESEHDKWESGHAGTSVSAMVGYLYANKLNDKKSEVISIVGDASITNGTNLEALTYLGNDPNHKGIIVLNDNNMSISKRVGAFSAFLTRLRGSRFNNFLRRLADKFIPNFLWRFHQRVKRSIKAMFQASNMFEDMGYVYIGPINGNNLKRTIRALKQAKKYKRSVLLHVITQKGMGYKYAEEDIEGSYHGVGPFDKDSGETLSDKTTIPTWSSVMASCLAKLEEERHIFVVMPAMLVGAKFSNFQLKYPHRIVDVGIAEEQAAVMSAALALNNIDVFLPLYSTFAQRAYDQIMNDIARPGLKVVIGIDRAGFVGEDGSTHQGLFDISMFMSMPNVTITMPKDMKEAYGILKYAFMQNGPFVIRYPRGKTHTMDIRNVDEIRPSWELFHKGTKGYIIAYGPSVIRLKDLVIQENLSFSVVNARYINPMDERMLEDILKTGEAIYVYEETHGSGTLYHHILEYMADHQYHNVIKARNTKDLIIHHGTIDDNMKDANMDDDALLEDLKRL